MGVLKLNEQESATIEVKGDRYDLPVITGSESEVAIDISTLRGKSKVVTLDNAYVNTAACQSAITFLDGEKGILRYRDYPIEQLAEQSTFTEVAYLLFHGELPSAEKLSDFEKQIAASSKADPNILKMVEQFPAAAHPMGVLSALTVALSANGQELLNPDLSVDQRWDAVALMMGQIKTLSTAFFRHANQQKPIESDTSLDYCSDFYQLMFGKKPDSAIQKALNVLFILHADHEQNCSTSTVRLVGSSKANVFATTSAGINALWGPLHGGANQAVIEMLEEIEKAGGDYKKFLDKAKDKNDPFKLMGFGHRVYKNFDPRANIIKKTCSEVLETLGVKDPLLDIAMGLETEARKDPYFVDRKLYPNVDFYSGIIYKALGIPTNMFTVMFVLGRLPGWLAQWNEMLASDGFKIGRPRQIYTGHTSRDYKK